TQAPDATVLADFELLHRAPSLHLADAGEGFQNGDHLELDDRVVGVALRQQFAEADRSSLQLLLQLGPLASGGSCLLEGRLALRGIKLRREGHGLGTSGGVNETFCSEPVTGDYRGIRRHLGLRRTRSV